MGILRPVGIGGSGSNSLLFCLCALIESEQMAPLLLLIGIALFIAAIYFHTLAQANVITKIDRAWFERLFTGSRASRDILTEERRS